MICSRLAIFSILALLIGTTGARAVDKKKLRRTVHLPHTSIIVGYSVNRRGEFMVNPAETTSPQSKRIAELEKELKGDGTDVERYGRLAELYYRCGQSAKGKETRRKVVLLLRKQLEWHPDDLACRLRLAEALEDVEELDEAEKLVRRVVSDCPSDWHAWLALGKILDSKCHRAITNGKPLRPTGPEALLQSMREAQPTPERIAASRRYRQEVVACFDRAVALAPRTSETYRLRGGSRYSYGPLDLGLRLYKGEKAGKDDFIECFLGREAMPDLRKAVELSRDAYMSIGMVAAMEISAEVHDHQIQNPSTKQPEKLVDILSESTRKRVRKDIARLEKGVQNPDKHKAAEAAEALSFLQVMSLQDESAAEKNARRSIALDPEREAAWEILLGILMKSKAVRKTADLCRQRLEHKDSARNRLLLAKAYEELDQLEKAEAVIQVGLNHEPDDFMLRLAQADMLLMRGDSESLNQAGQLLYKMRTDKLSDGGDEDRWANYTFTCGVYFGLLGEREQANKWLEKLRQGEPEYPGLKEALQALDEPGEATSPRPVP